MPTPPPPDDPAFEARVRRAFIRDGRLVAIPARERKKLVILRFLLDAVLPDADPVGEAELNLRIALVHPDASALRRFLVDYGFATRDAGVYRRAIPPSAAAPFGGPRQAPERP